MTIAAIGQDAKESSQINGLSGSLAQRVLNAIKTASKDTGVNFTYLVNKAAQESGFKPDAKASTSSATGLYQFTEQTWLRTVAAYGDKHGMGVLANKIETRVDGYAIVKDRYLKQQILELRKNPEMAAAMAAELAQENKASLQTQIGGEIGNTELYLAHFLGASGAADFISAVRGNPGAKGAELLPAAAAANKSVFYGEGGKPRTVADIYNRFAAKMDGKGIDVPADVAVSPAMFAELGSTLSQLPEMRLSAAENIPTKMAGLSAPGFAGLGGTVSAESLFSTMILSQMDALNAHVIDAKADKANRDDRVSASLA